MAFRPYSTEDGRVPAWEYYPATGLTPKVGMALNLTGGKLVAATGTVKPQFVCMAERGAAQTAEQLIPVIAAADDIIWEVETAATLALGAACSIGNDSLTVVSGSGAGKVVAATENGVCRVRFGAEPAAAATA